ncbi:MAG: DUF378 domain-containing protein [Patescibacteria group bacterium]|nr:DUF378 domain-containing protein [Patescibacteria group bacterium]
MNVLNWIAYVLVVVGGLNWGLIGLFDLNLVNKILGSVSWLEKLVYILVGLSALLIIFTVRPGPAKAKPTQQPAM